MPLLKRKAFEKSTASGYLRDDDEVFHCEITDEIFKDYEKYCERIILVNSGVWSCEMTGMNNLTYAEALESEKAAKQARSLRDFPMELRIPILYLASRTQRSSFAEMSEDVFNYVRERFFVGETVEACLEGDSWQEAHVLSITAQKQHPGSKAMLPASSYCYEVEQYQEDNPTAGKVGLAPHDRVRRRKGVYSRDKNRLFLKQFVQQMDGIITIKKVALDKYKIGKVNFDRIFTGNPPEFSPSKKLLKSSPTKTLAKSGSATKLNKSAKKGTPDKKGQQQYMDKVVKKTDKNEYSNDGEDNTLISLKKTRKRQSKEASPHWNTNTTVDKSKDDVNTSASKKPKRPLTNGIHEEKPVNGTSRKRSKEVPQLHTERLEQLMKKVLKHRDCWLFLYPVTTEIAPDYSDWIEQPMDFTTIKEKLSRGEYETDAQLLDDAALVFHNCYIYNRKTHPIFKAGVRLEKYIQRCCSDLSLPRLASCVRGDLCPAVRCKYIEKKPMNGTSRKRSKEVPQLHQERLEQLMKEVLKRRDCWPFDEPVDTEMAPDYLDVIEQLMDFTTIKEKLSRGEYETDAQLLDDAALVFHTCYTYHYETHPIFKAGVRLENYIHWRCSDLSLPRLPEFDPLRASVRIPNYSCVRGDLCPAVGQEKPMNGTARKRSKEVPQLHTERLEQLMKEVLKHRDCWPFNEPVDTEMFPDYLDVIEQPMDFSTIKEKLSRGEYETDAQLLDDAALVFHNCYTFNKQRALVFKAGVRLEKYIQRRCSDLSLPRLPEFKPVRASVWIPNFPCMTGDLCPALGQEKPMNGTTRKRSKEVPQLHTERLEQLMKEVLKHRDCWLFNEPVDTEMYPDYLDWIEQPMDFPTIKEKLSRGEYETDAQLLDDAALVFHNCYRYNKETHLIFKAGVRLEKYIQRRCSDLSLPRLPEFKPVRASVRIPNYSCVRGDLCPAVGQEKPMNGTTRKRSKEVPQLHQERLEQLMKEVLKHRDCWPFDEPVDTEMAPDYLEVIEQLMDFTTIKEKLSRGEYETDAQLLDDAALVFHTCYTYYDGTHPIFKAGVCLEKYIQGRCADLSLPPLPRVEKTRKHSRFFLKAMVF